MLVADRTDIATSAELDGVVLTDDGVPTVVARKTLAETALVVHESESAEEAEKASKEGADYSSCATSASWTPFDRG